MRQALDRQRGSLALSDPNSRKFVANIFRHRSSSRRDHELPPLLNDNKIFLIDDTDKRITGLQRAAPYIHRRPPGLRLAKMDMAVRLHPPLPKPPMSTIKQESPASDRHTCYKCGRRYSTTGILNRHIRVTHTVVGSFECETCGRVYLNPDKLKHHIQSVHTDLGSFECNVCGKIFYLSRTLRRLILEENSALGSFNCNSCGKRWPSSFTPWQQRDKVTNSRLPSFPCEMCGRVCLTDNGLRRHMRTVHLEHLPYECRTCHISAPMSAKSAESDLRSDAISIGTLTASTEPTTPSVVPIVQAVS
ncbi:hypothetical protein SprV_0501943700 [Sparganum proliferum]